MTIFMQVGIVAGVIRFVFAKTLIDCVISLYVQVCRGRCHLTLMTVLRKASGKIALQTCFCRHHKQSVYVFFVNHNLLFQSDVDRLLISMSSLHGREKGFV